MNDNENSVEFCDVGRHWVDRDDMVTGNCCDCCYEPPPVSAPYEMHFPGKKYPGQ